jgi:hypothetical protein
MLSRFVPSFIHSPLNVLKLLLFLQQVTAAANERSQSLSYDLTVIGEKAQTYGHFHLIREGIRKFDLEHFIGTTYMRACQQALSITLLAASAPPACASAPR